MTCRVIMVGLAVWDALLLSLVMADVSFSVVVLACLSAQPKKRSKANDDAAANPRVNNDQSRFRESLSKKKWETERFLGLDSFVYYE